MKRKALTRDLALCPMCPLCPLLSPECMESSNLFPSKLMFSLVCIFFTLLQRRLLKTQTERKLKRALGVQHPGRVCTFPWTLISDSFTVLWVEESWALGLEISFEKLGFQSTELIVPSSPFYCPLGCYKVISVFLATSACSLSLGPVKNILLFTLWVKWINEGLWYAFATHLMRIMNLSFETVF